MNDARSAFRRHLTAIWDFLVGLIGVVVGLAPHILHHAGVLVGTALVAGVVGTVLFGVLGLLASIPFLLKLRHRYGSWRAPGVALAIFVVTFALSSLVIGPAIRGSAEDGGALPQPTPSDHDLHHD